MRKTQIFEMNKGYSKAVKEIDDWLAQNEGKKIVSMAGTNIYLIIVYEC